MGLREMPCTGGGPSPRTVGVVKPLVILPTYNEAENIVEVLERIQSALPQADVLVVDDGSPDGTGDLADQWGGDNGGHVSVLRRGAKAGLGSAYRAGFAYGLAKGYDALIEMDSDLQHDPAALPSLVNAVESGADLAIGSRSCPVDAFPTGLDIVNGCQEVEIATQRLCCAFKFAMQLPDSVAMQRQCCPESHSIS